MVNWDYYKILTYISSFSVIIPLFFIYSVRRKTKTLWIIYLYLVLSLLTEIALMEIANSGKSNLLFIQFFSLGELILIIEIYKASGFFKESLFPKFNLLYAIGYIFLLIEYLSAWSGLFDAFEHTCIISFSLWAFYKLFLINDESEKEINPFFWFNLGFFFYFCTTFFLFLSGTLTRTYGEIAKLLWTFHLLANMLLYCFITVGIWKQKTI